MFDGWGFEERVSEPTAACAFSRAHDAPRHDSSALSFPTCPRGVAHSSHTVSLVSPPCSASGASVVAIDNKIEQAMVSWHRSVPTAHTFPGVVLQSAGQGSLAH